MMCVLRQRLVSIAALIAYLVVNVGAGALHHHHRAAAARPGTVPAACGTGLQFQTAGQPGDEDDEDACLLCSVLHLAQTVPGKLHVAVLIVPTGQAFSAAAIIQPLLLATPSRARSPPTA
jgi:hypothetical protein